MARYLSYQRKFRHVQAEDARPGEDTLVSREFQRLEASRMTDIMPSPTISNLTLVTITT